MKGPLCRRSTLPVANRPHWESRLRRPSEPGASSPRPPQQHRQPEFPSHLGHAVFRAEIAMGKKQGVDARRPKFFHHRRHVRVPEQQLLTPAYTRPLRPAPPPSYPPAGCASCRRCDPPRRPRPQTAPPQTAPPQCGRYTRQPSIRRKSHPSPSDPVPGSCGCSLPHGRR